MLIVDGAGNRDPLYPSTVIAAALLVAGHPPLPAAAAAATGAGGLRGNVTCVAQAGWCTYTDLGVTLVREAVLMMMMMMTMMMMMMTMIMMCAFVVRVRVMRTSGALARARLLVCV